jgi:uncharacterized protein YjhX (UPF0386 family)
MFELRAGKKYHLVVSRVTSGKIKRYKDFLSWKKLKRVDSWSATKLFAPGDLAFFYFGKPIGSIVAIAGVDSKPRDRIGRFDWTKRRKATFCKYRPVWFFKKPIQLSTSLKNATIVKWYQGKPYRTTQKIPEKVALALLLEIITINPTIKMTLIKRGFIIAKRS